MSDLTPEDVAAAEAAKTETDISSATEAPRATETVPKAPEEVASLKAQLERMKQESIEHRRKADTLQAEKDAAEQKKLAESGEFEKLNALKDRQLQDLQDSLKRKDVELELVKHHVIDPDVVKLIDLKRVQVDVNNEVINAAQVVAEFVAVKPHLFSPPPPPKTEVELAAEAEAARKAADAARAATGTSRLGVTPTPSGKPVEFNARDKKISLEEINRGAAAIIKSLEGK